MSTPNREKEIFEQALDLDSPEERAAFLRQACGEDEALLRRIEALLKAGATTVGFLPGAAGRSPDHASGTALAEGPGTVIGRYKLLEQIGEGGFGVVYMAEQVEPVRRRVALKIIKPGMDSKQVIGRFEAERQALALMDHPNIAQIYDAGTVGDPASRIEPLKPEIGNQKSETSAGRPYFVMELVKGLPITRFCEEQQLNLEARLKLFIQVCSAVQHAHQKGIIHRDLKPSNILVTLHGDQPVPKVIDFGIAKATQQPLTDKTVFTHFQQFIGTPAYMSPEQAAMSALDVDTRSDIYSLGVMLYELLTGTPPFDTRELLKAGLDEMRRIIREREPERPSTRVTQQSRRTTSPNDYRKSRIASDLDWIVLKCLEKDRARRYETANGLAADLQRHLRNEPVVARPPSTAYQIQKAWQRHKTAFALATVMALVLLAATAFSTWQAHVARQAAASERKAREEVTARAATERAAREEAETIVTFLSNVFRSPDPSRDGRAITVAESLDRAAQKLDTELAAQPARRAVMQSALAEAYLGLGLAQHAATLFEQVLSHYRTASGPTHPQSLKAMTSLATAYEDSGRLWEAMELREQVRSLREQVQGREHPDTLESAAMLAKSYGMIRGKQEQGIQLMEEVLAAWQRLLGPDHRVTRTAQFALDSLRLAGRTTRMGDLVDAARERFEQTRLEQGPDHPQTILAMADLAFHTPFTRAAEKLRIAADALALSRKVNGIEHTTTLRILSDLAGFQRTIGKLNDAVVSFETAVPLSRKLYGTHHEFTLGQQFKLATAYSLAGRHEEALRLAETTLPLYRNTAGDEGSLGAIQTLADLYLAVPNGRRAADAVELLEEAAQMVRLRQPESTSAVSLGDSLAHALSMVNRKDEAIQLYDQLAALNLRVHGFESRDTAGWMMTIGRGYARLGRPDLAVPVLEAALPLCERFHGPNADLTIATIHSLILAYFKAGRLIEGQRLLTAAAHGSPPNPWAALHLAALQLWTGDHEGYAGTRDRLLEWAASTVDANTAHRTARLASLSDAEDPAIVAAALALARRAVELNLDDRAVAQAHLSLAMAEYRSGHYSAMNDALAIAEQATRSSTESARLFLRQSAQLHRIMGLIRQGRPEDARELLLNIQPPLKTPPADKLNPWAKGADENDLLLCLAYAETQALLDPPVVRR